MVFPDLAPALGSIEWAVTGAAAARLYMPERATRDLDVVIRFEDGPRARERLRLAGLSYQGELAIGGSSWRTRDGFPVDVVECREPWVGQALKEAQSNRDSQGLPVLPMPYLVLMKFQAGRVQDLADVTRILGQAGDEALTSVRAIFAQWLPDGLEDLEGLIELGRLEMSR
ncbi:MAG: hypothetical protein FJ291_13795 [Planctomycetes bacterium]|nr:hypothetical protein [Planctomycetota bacterium]